ncbi:MAG: hypothetical protein QG668_450 [Patescibacteria group bacterium]|nr:hypothetical protein [Patescibacteria group bacterium]
MKGGRICLDQGERPAVAVLRSCVERGRLTDRKSDQHAHRPRIGGGGRHSRQDLVHGAAVIHQTKAEPRRAFRGERVARRLTRRGFDAQMPQRVADRKRSQSREGGPAQSPAVAGGGVQKGGYDTVLGMDGKDAILRGRARIGRVRRRRAAVFRRGGGGFRVGHVLARGVGVIGRGIRLCAEGSGAGVGHLKRETAGREQADRGKYDERNKPGMLLHDPSSFFVYVLRNARHKTPRSIGRRGVSRALCGMVK